MKESKFQELEQRDAYRALFRHLIKHPSHVIDQCDTVSPWGPPKEVNLRRFRRVNRLLSECMPAAEADVIRLFGPETGDTRHQYVGYSYFYDRVEIFRLAGFDAPLSHEFLKHFTYLKLREG